MAKGIERDRQRETYWRRMVRGQPGGGLTVRAFCRKNKLAESAFYFWGPERLEPGSTRMRRSGWVGQSVATRMSHTACRPAGPRVIGRRTAAPAGMARGALTRPAGRA